MKSQRSWTNLIALTMTVITLGGSWGAWGLSPVGAIQNTQGSIDPTPRECPGCRLTSDPFGIVANQAARLNILNRAEERAIIIDWKFLDSEGNTLAESREPISVLPGQIVSDDFFADGHNVARDRFGRIQMRVVVTTQRHGPEPHLSVEVFDSATGKTSFTTKFCQNNL